MIVDGSELCIDRVVAVAILEELTEGEEGSAVEEHFGDDASCAEDVHWFCDAVVLDGDGIVVEAFWCDVAGAPSACVVEEGKVGWVVEGEMGWFVGSKVGDVDPV